MKNRAKRFLFFLIVSCFFISTVLGGNPRRKFFRKTNRFFRKHVEDGRVDYGKLLNRRGDLEKLTRMIADFPVNKCKPRVQKAFYINAYNLLLIKNILQKYPVEFPLEYTGLFSQIENKVGEDTLTLNELEEEILIGRFKDVRVLFVLSSACEGSVPLADHAYKPRKLVKQFSKAIKATANSFDYVRVMNRSKRVLLAEALRKSLTDFKKEDLVFYLNKYREEPLPAEYAIDFYPANRKINIR